MVYNLTYWADHTKLCYKGRQTLVPVVDDSVFLDEPVPAHYRVTGRRIVYFGDKARADIYVELETAP